MRSPLAAPGPAAEADVGANVASTPQDVRVVIYDQEYHMRAELDPEYIRGLAEFVDGKMRSIAARTRTVDSLRTAILAALNIADEPNTKPSRNRLIGRSTHVPKCWIRFSLCSPGLHIQAIERSAQEHGPCKGIERTRILGLRSPACEVGEWPHGYLNQHRFNGSLTRLPGELDSRHAGMKA